VNNYNSSGNNKNKKNKKTKKEKKKMFLEVQKKKFSFPFLLFFTKSYFFYFF